MKSTLIPTPFRAGLWAALALYALLVLLGMLAVAARDPIPRTPTLRPVIDPQSDDLALFSRGAVVRVSSYHNRYAHHPLYLIDGRMAPSSTEQWSPSDDDRDPWFEVFLPNSVTLTRVTLAHASRAKNADETRNAKSRYHLMCREGDREIARVEVVDSGEQVTHHALDCPSADTLRVEFSHGPPGTRRPPVGIYEVQIGGTLGGIP
ncbi:MAG: hypothetical protein JRG94_16785 [Deltaproteobacteria bacterium]|nr:hypothetical protein [Deltaproteobacteria bacterium]